MADVFMEQLVKNQAKKKFYGNNVLISKVSVRYKDSIEREYRRVLNDYIRLVKPIFNEYLQSIAEVYRNEVKGITVRHDDKHSLMSAIQSMLAKMSGALAEKMQAFDIQLKLSSIAEQSKKLSVKEWKNIVSRTLGVNILDDYYLGDFYRDAVSQWVSDNVDMVKSIPQDLLGEMKTIIEKSYLAGESFTKVTERLQKQYHLKRNDAKFLARDQTAKLNSKITRMQQETAGCSEYIWSTSGDSRVRDSHKKLNGKRFKWSEPPIVDEKTGRRAHPGEDYQCRCVAIPVFSYDNLNLPI